MLLRLSLSPEGRPKDILKILRALIAVTSVKEVTGKQVISAGMHRPVCPDCNCEMQPNTNGIGVLDYAEYGPYELWDADLWKCPKCGKKVVGGFGSGPIASHFNPDFQAAINRYKNVDKLITNDG